MACWAAISAAPICCGVAASRILPALTTTSFSVVWAVAFCVTNDEKATAMAAASGLMRYPMKLSLDFWYLSGALFSQERMHKGMRQIVAGVGGFGGAELRWRHGLAAAGCLPLS